jgi:subtilisin family serine protease
MASKRCGTLIAALLTSALMAPTAAAATDHGQSSRPEPSNQFASPGNTKAKPGPLDSGRKPAVDAVQEIIVKARPGRQAGAASAAAALGLQKKKTIGLIGAQVMRVPAGKTKRALASLKANPDVLYAEPNQQYRAAALPAPNDPLYGQLWGLHNTGQTVGGWQGAADVDIDAPEAWTATQGRAGVVVGVIDSGIDLTHPDLAQRIWTNPGEIAGNGIDDDANGYVDDVHGWDFWAQDNDPSDENGHGTHVAGTIAGTANNGVGVAGVAPGVTIMPLRFLGPDGSGDLAGALEAISYATAQGAPILNNSWGGGGYSEPLRDAIAASGTAFITAAGNEGRNLDQEGEAADYPGSYTLPNILNVAAVDNEGYLAPFSNYGTRSVDVAAPGYDILSAAPAVPELPRSITADVGSGRAVAHGFGLEEVAGTGARAAVLARSLQALGTAPGDPVLLVDDDAVEAVYTGQPVPDYQQTYLTALAGAGYTNVTTVDVAAASSGPDAAALAGKTVLWQTGDGDSGPDLLGADQQVLDGFLAGGGKLLLAGKWWTWGSEDWLGTTLSAAESPDYFKRTALTGTADTAFGGLNVTIDGSGDPYGSYASWTGFRSLAPTTVPVLVHPASPSSWQMLSGTSMAAPHVAGIAALIKSAAGGLTSQELVNRIKAKAAFLPPANGAVATNGMANAALSAKNLLPAAPKGVKAAPRNGEAKISWNAVPAGGLNAPTYRVVAQPGGKTVTTRGTYAVVRGLAPGTTYSFTIRASNGAGTGAVSARVTAKGTKLSAGTSSSKVVYGETVKVRGSLRAGTAAVPNRQVAVYHRKKGTSAWRLLGKTVTSSTGAYTYLAKPAFSTEYSVRFPGGPGYMGRTSGTVATAVARRVSMALNSSTVARGTSVAVTGKALPAARGKQVQLQRYAGGWKTVSRETVGRYNWYRFTVRHSAAGDYRYRVLIPRDGGYAAGKSAAGVLRVR